MLRKTGFEQKCFWHLKNSKAMLAPFCNILIFTAFDVGNCDIDFFIFQHCQVQNFEILNLSSEIKI
jgi:hypothetical protein